LIVTFVTTVTLWYFVTPYIVNPHSGIIADLISRTQIEGPPGSSVVGGGDVKAMGDSDNTQMSILVENWTKWRLYVKGDSNQVVHRGTSDMLHINNSKAVMFMEWRPQYEIVVDVTGSDSSGRHPQAQIVAPLMSFQRWGIYNHLAVEWTENANAVPTLRVLPRFLFGIPVQTVSQMYGGGSTPTSVPSASDPIPDVKEVLSNLPIIGVFSHSNFYDRVIIQAYMNLVTLSVIFLLWANNPPESLLKKNLAVDPVEVPSTSSAAAATGSAELQSFSKNEESTDAEKSPKVSNGRRRVPSTAKC